jgi:DNA-binding NtrC family response regulator
MAARSALLVDDDPSTTDAVRELLPWREVRVETTSDPRAAIDCLKKTDYCGLVLNLEVPSGKSRDVLLHMSEQHIDIPVVVIASEFPESLRELPVAESIKLVMAKPVDPSLLASIILGLCGIER